MGRWVETQAAVTANARELARAVDWSSRRPMGQERT